MQKYKIIEYKIKNILKKIRELFRLMSGIAFNTSINERQSVKNIQHKAYIHYTKKSDIAVK